MKASPVRIGTSGWSYDHWQDVFYPAKLGKAHWLEYYARQLHSVEINNSFYHLPDEATLQQWYEAVPNDFSFSVKASRYITHMKKLKDAEDSVAQFIERISLLRHKLGPVLFQLPPRWRFNRERLAKFLGCLDTNFRYAFEFRDHSWLNPETCRLLAEHNAAFCIYELDGFLSPREVTADFVYLRLHGPGEAYQGNYQRRVLSGWAQAMSDWHARGQAVYCYFDNDQAGYAVRNALSLQAMLDH